MTYSLSDRSRINMAGVHPDLIRIVEGAIVSSAVDFGITGRAMRTASEQASLYAQGRTKPGARVTDKDGYRNKSNHQPHEDGWGHAVDLTPYLDGKPILDDRAWKLYPAVASAMSVSAKALGLAGRLKWGCNWTQAMDHYGSQSADMQAQIDTHAGHFIDGPHFELA